MAITEIKYGSLASSKELNDNFNTLNKDIQDLATNLSTTNANMATSMSTLNKNVASQISEVNESLTNTKSELEEKVKTLDKGVSDLSAKDDKPNYSKGWGISLPYTCTEDGEVYAGVNGIDSGRYVYVSGKKVHGHCGYSGGKWVYSGSTFRVSKGDVVTCDYASGDYFFYPKKGA